MDDRKRKPTNMGPLQRTRRTVSAGLATLTSGRFGTSPYELHVVDQRTGEAIANYHGHWHGSLPSIPVGEAVTLEPVVETADGTELSLGTDERDRVEVAVVDESIADSESHGDHLTVTGASPGETAVTFRLLSEGDLEWETSEPIDVDVLPE